MKNGRKKLTAAVLSAVLALSALLTGCGKTAQSVSSGDGNEMGKETGQANETAQDVSTEGGEERTKIVIATSGTGPVPFCYQDDSGKLTGYDIEVIEAVFEHLPQYEPEFAICDFASIFTGIDAGLYQVGLNHMGYNKERAQKYLYTDVYDVGIHAIAVRKGYDEILSVQDFGGHSTQIQAASANEKTFLSYNEEHPNNPIDLTYIEVDNMLLDIIDGKIDFEYFTKATLKAQIEEKGLQEEIDLFDVPIEDSNNLGRDLKGNFYLVSKNDEQLAADINGQLAALIADGTINGLRTKWFGEDADELTLEYVQYCRDYIAAEETE